MPLKSKLKLKMKLTACFYAVIFLILTPFIHSMKSHSRRAHSNLYHNIKSSDIEKIIKFDPFLLLLIGHANEGIFEKYKGAMNTYTIKHSINKSWLHFGYMDIRHHPMLKQKYDLKKFPVFLHFYEGELIKKDYRFNIHMNPEADLDLKFLHSILDIFPNFEEMRSMMEKSLCTVFFDLNESETKHFDVTLQKKINYLKIAAESFATLPKDEFVFIGLDYKNLDTKTRNYFSELNSSLKFDGIMLFSHDSKTIYELSQNTILEKKGEFFKNWIYHHAHGFLAEPKLAFKNIVKRKNFGLLLFHTSENIVNEKLTQKAILNFEEMAKNFKGKIQFTICDVYLDKICEEFLHTFELEYKEMPFVRVLYASVSDTSEHFRVFKLKTDVIEKAMKELKMSEMDLEISEFGIKRLITDFNLFDVDLDIKMEKLPDKDTAFIEKSEAILKKHIHADLELRHILKLNYVYLKDFIQFLNLKDRIIFFYDSRKHDNLIKNYQEVFRLFFKNKKYEMYHKYFIFASYDIAKNTKHGINIDNQQLPILRYYRKEESIFNYYNDRFAVRSNTEILNAIIDFCSHDIIADFEEEI